MEMVRLLQKQRCWLKLLKKNKYMISPLANVSSSSILGKDVVIDSFSTVFEDVEIGDGTRIHPNVTLYPGTRIGKNCEIFPGAVIGVVPQDLKFDGEYTTVEIGENKRMCYNSSWHIR